MEAKSFDRSLRAPSQRVPFQAFTVELISGARIAVEYPEALVYRNGVAVHFARDGALTLFDHVGVAQLISVTDQHSAAA